MCLGLGLGALYDVFSFFPDVFGKKFLRPVFDILYCVVFMAAFIALVQVMSMGQIRWYIPGGIIMGLIIYFAGLSDYIKVVLSIFAHFFNTIFSVFRKVAAFFLKIWRAIVARVSKHFDTPQGN